MVQAQSKHRRKLIMVAVALGLVYAGSFIPKLIWWRMLSFVPITMTIALPVLFSWSAKKELNAGCSIWFGWLVSIYGYTFVLLSILFQPRPSPWGWTPLGAIALFFLPLAPFALPWIVDKKIDEIEGRQRVQEIASGVISLDEVLSQEQLSDYDRKGIDELLEHRTDLTTAQFEAVLFDFGYLYEDALKSPHLPEEMIRRVEAQHHGEHVTLSLAKNPNTSADVLASMLASADIQVMAAAFNHPNAPMDARRNSYPSLINSRYDIGRAAAAASSIASEQDLYHLAQDESEFVREAVALNPNTPQDLLESLLEDDQWKVRQGAKKTLEAKTASAQ